MELSVPGDILLWINYSHFRHTYHPEQTPEIHQSKAGFPSQATPRIRSLVVESSLTGMSSNDRAGAAPGAGGGLGVGRGASSGAAHSSGVRAQQATKTGLGGGGGGLARSGRRSKAAAAGPQHSSIQDECPGGMAQWQGGPQSRGFATKN